MCSLYHFFFFIEFKHEVNVVSTSSSAVPAGGVVVLTCEAISNIPPKLTWVGPSGPVKNGNGVTVVTYPDALHSNLAFYPLRPSHAGQYTCISSVEDVDSVKEASKLVSVQG